MLKIIRAIPLVLLALSAQAQKIKVKKGDILVDKVTIGHIEKVKIKNDSIKENYHKITNKEGDHIFNFRSEYIESPLYLKDKKYTYNTIEYVKNNKRSAVQNPKFYPTEKNIAKYLVEYKLLNENGLNDEAVSEFIINKGLLPAAIEQTIKEEEELKTYASFKPDRTLSDPVFIFFNKTTAGVSSVSKGVVTKSKYNIYQGVKDPKTNEFVSKTFIGYAIAEDEISGDDKIGWSTNPPKNYRPNPAGSYKLLVYNTKKVPLASYLSIVYKTYHPFAEYGPTKTDLSRLEKVEINIKSIVLDLISKGKL